MYAGTCWDKNTIDPSDRGVEKPRKATLTLTFTQVFQMQLLVIYFIINMLHIGLM
jgi:hypothetical protein